MMYDNRVGKIFFRQVRKGTKIAENNDKLHYLRIVRSFALKIHRKQSLKTVHRMGEDLQHI